MRRGVFRCVRSRLACAARARSRRGVAAAAVAMLALAPRAHAQRRPASPPATSVARVETRVAVLPGVVGLSADSATRMLRAYGVGIVRVDTNASPRDQVVAQRPPAGTPLARVKIDTLMVALPRRTVSPQLPAASSLANRVAVPPGSNATTVPPRPQPIRTIVPLLIGRPEQMVVWLLDSMHLRASGPLFDSSDVVPRGLAFRQQPGPKTVVDTGTLVTVWYSLGPHRGAQTVPVPDLIKRTVAQADSMLRVARLRLGSIDTSYRSGTRAILIYDQSPEPRTTAHPGDQVSVSVVAPPTPVSVPPAGNPQPTPRRTTVPSLGGLTRDAAEQVLLRDSLRLGDVVLADDGANAVVATQRPVAGTSVFFYQQVGITLATPPAQPGQPPATVPPAQGAAFVRVPDVLNMLFEPARQLLDSLGLRTVSTIADTGRTLAVATQTPRAGTLVRPGARVVLTLVPVTPVIPDLVGMTESDAREHAQRHGFSMAPQRRRRGLQSWIARVVSQEPATETIRRADAAIRVDLTIPLVPPIPAGIALVVAATAAVALKVRPHPLTNVNFELGVAPSPAPRLDVDPARSLVRAAITFTLDPGRGEGRVEPSNQSLVERITPHV
jgi:beta-lactam-binding protein with PASTA domain